MDDQMTARAIAYMAIQVCRPFFVEQVVYSILPHGLL